ncbi:MAG TPA: hypothetical protein PKY05_19795 [Fibrobacteria bacterium]|nr:hypothetical protein [Fibrobacteria bacterium]
MQWAVWVDLVINAGKSIGDDHLGITMSNIKILQVLELLLSPGVLFELIGKISENGTWGIRGNAVSGVFLIGIWVIETGMLLVLPLLQSTLQSQKPFCEVCGEWFKEEELPPFQYIEDVQAFKSSLENLEVSPLGALKQGGSKETDHCIVTRYSSPANAQCYLSVHNKKAKVSDKGEVEFDDQPLAEYVLAKAG